MGAMSNAFYDQALQGFAESIEKLVAEEFQRYSDALGDNGRGIVAATFNMLSRAFQRAATVTESQEQKDRDPNPIELSKDVVIDGQAHRFTLMSNNCTCREPCSLCGKIHKDAEVPHWIFQHGHRGICGECAELYVPDLLQVAMALNKKFWVDQDPKDGTDVLRAKTHNVELTNQDIIELSYMVRDLVTLAAKQRAKLCWEEANCYGSTISTCCELLKNVDTEYLQQHDKLASFFNEVPVERNSDTFSFSDDQELL